MNYWVIKGRPDRNDWNRVLVPGRTELWRTKRLPRSLTAGDRVFFWVSGAERRLIALGEIVGTREGLATDGASLFRVRYLTRRLTNPPGISTLRQVPELSSVSFLKAGPATTLFPLALDEAAALFRTLLALGGDEYLPAWTELRFLPALFLHPDWTAASQEGGQRLALHLHRERDSALVKRKKATAASLACECCGFDFAEVYGERGQDFCEVHHNEPLGSTNQSRLTRLSELSIVCSNCHRMLHRNPVFTVSELRELLHSRPRSVRVPQPVAEIRQLRTEISTAYGADIRGILRGLRIETNGSDQARPRLRARRKQ
jgi:hypothetical protein